MIEALHIIQDRSLSLPRCDTFLNAKRAELKQSTYADYVRVINNHIKPFFKNSLISSVSPIRIQEFLSYLEKKGLKAATSGKVFRYLKVIIRYAIALESLTNDPTKAIRSPKVKFEEMDFFNPDEVALLLDAAEGDFMVLLATACFTGLRQGELLGLMWKDIDFKNKFIRVLRTYHYEHGFSDPKTASSKRAVPMVGTLANMLAEYYERRGQPDKDDLVFPNRDGKPQDRRNLVRRDFKRTLDGAGLREIKFHELRHTYASLCIASGMDAKALQHAMGHSSIRVTMDIYGHLFPGSYDQAMERMDILISPKKEPIHR